jgi:hypothetical protein
VLWLPETETGCPFKTQLLALLEPHVNVVLVLIGINVEPAFKFAVGTGTTVTVTFLDTGPLMLVQASV